MCQSNVLCRIYHFCDCVSQNYERFAHGRNLIQKPAAEIIAFMVNYLELVGHIKEYRFKLIVKFKEVIVMCVEQKSMLMLDL